MNIGWVNQQRYSSLTRIRYHGSAIKGIKQGQFKPTLVSHLNESVPLFWTTSDISYARNYARVSFESGSIYVGRFTRKLNIFNAQSKRDWIFLTSYLPQLSGYKYLLQREDWLGLFMASNGLFSRDDIFKLAWDSSVYDGVFNYECVGASDAVGLFNADVFGCFDELRYNSLSNTWDSVSGNRRVSIDD